MAMLALNLLTGGNASPARLVGPPGEQPGHEHQAQARDVEGLEPEEATLAKRMFLAAHFSWSLTNTSFRRTRG